MSLSAIEAIQTEMTASEILLNIVLQNQELEIAIAANPMSAYSSVGTILQRDLLIEPGEASIWSRLDALGQFSARLMIHRPLYGKWVVITPGFGSHNIIIQYSEPMTFPPLVSTTYFRTT